MSDLDRRALVAVGLDAGLDARPLPPRSPDRVPPRPTIRAVLQGRLPLSPSAKTVLRDSSQEMRHFGGRHLGSPHVLEALLQLGPHDPATELFAALGIDRDAALLRLVELGRRRNAARPDDPSPDPDRPVTATGGVDPDVARVAGVSYLRIPAVDAGESAVFYRAVFGWVLRGDPERPSFTDGTGHVIGTWDVGRDVAGEAGVLPYVFVASVAETLARVTDHGGEIITPPEPEGNLLVATFRDPASTVIGVWQERPA